MFLELMDGNILRSVLKASDESVKVGRNIYIESKSRVDVKPTYGVVTQGQGVRVANPRFTKINRVILCERDRG